MSFSETVPNNVLSQIASPEVQLCLYTITSVIHLSIKSNSIYNTKITYVEWLRKDHTKWKFWTLILSSLNRILSSNKGSHVIFLLNVFWVILLLSQLVLLFDINVMLPWWPDVKIVQSDVTILVPWQLSTESKHDYLFCYCPLVGILFEVRRIRGVKMIHFSNINWEFYNL